MEVGGQEMGGQDLPYNKLSSDRRLVDAIEGAVLALATRGEVEELLDSSQAPVGIAPALQGDVPVARAQAQVALVRAGAGAEGRQRHSFIVVFWVAGVMDSRAGGRLLGAAKPQAVASSKPCWQAAQARESPSAPTKYCSHWEKHFPCI